MCGFAGFSDYSDSLTDEKYLWIALARRMARRISHRGPDDSGAHVSAHCALGHARLAIIDPENGAQPMTVRRDGAEFTIAYNGEIYNAPELRSELEAQGYVFETNCDTEVVLNAYLCFGEDCAEKLNGIFAFAVDDVPRQRTFLCRDRFGVKPLFYTIQGDRLAFASEIKALFEFPGVNPVLDKNGICEIFGLGPARTPGCGVFEGISELKPGHTAVFDREGFRDRRYFDLQAAPHEDDYDTTVRQVRELLLDTVERQMISDVPLCTFLSGGLDSSVVTAIAAQVLERSQSQKGALAQGLLNKAVYTPQAVYFDAPEEMPWLHMGSVKTTALALDALLFAKQNFEQAFESASWLIRQLNAQGHWNNTSDNAAVFTALNTYYQAKENAEPDFAAAVKLGAKTAFEQTFKGRSAEAKNGSVPFAQAYGQGTETRVTFAKTGAGTLYYTLGQVYEPLSYETPVNAGFEISRELTALDGKPVQTVRAGERYKVTLTVKNAAARHFVVAEDFVPAGFEIVNSELATESADIAVTDNGSDDYAFERNEKYDDRIAAFADYLPAGTHTYSYVVSALTSGTFAWPCAWASQMYEPAVFGRNATQTLVIK